MRATRANVEAMTKSLRRETTEIDSDDEPDFFDRLA